MCDLFITDFTVLGNQTGNNNFLSRAIMLIKLTNVVLITLDKKTSETESVARISMSANRELRMFILCAGFLLPRSPQLAAIKVCPAVGLCSMSKGKRLIQRYCCNFNESTEST